MKKKFLRVASTVLCGVLASSAFVGCGASSDGGKGKDAITIMTEELSGLFNPFYATSGTDMDVVGMTQIGMLSTDRDGNIVCGDEEPTVVKAYDIDTSNTKETVYTFVLKNGLKFSDGKPLTMNDVLFNMYEYLDPVYTGSSTMYSIDIKGLSQYRLQANYSGTGGDAASETLSKNANRLAVMRKQELIDLFEREGLLEGSQNSYSMTEAEMKEAIGKHNVSSGYKDAVATTKEKQELTNADYQEMLLADYEYTLNTFYDELESDYKAAKESFDITTAPYDKWASQYFTDDLQGELFRFFLYEGYITPDYAEDPNNPGRDDKLNIEKFDGAGIEKNYTTMEAAINRVYNDNVKTGLNNILSVWGTSGTLLTQYAGHATSVLLHNNLKGDGSLSFPNIEGIVSLGHTTDKTEVTIGNDKYAVAQEYNEDGTVKNDGEYAVLQITVNGQDPKAIYNFSFTVAPAHYYSADEQYPNGRPIDIKNNKFGVEWSNSDFQTKTIQSLQHLEIPVGAGAYKVTNANNSDTPKGDEFWSSNVVYYKANEHFMFPVKTEKLRMQVVSSTNALDKLEKGEIDYITPQFTRANAQRLQEMSKKGFVQADAWQLGYGYVGINAGKVSNIYIRRAIMAAMNPNLAIEYYEAGTCKPIAWPMSTVSWAYPWVDRTVAEDKRQEKPNGHPYTQWTDTTASAFADAKAEIANLMSQAGVTAGSNELKIKFTIAGASITEHPTYAVFKQASEILNSMGWDVEVKADSQALTKLSTGSLEVWAAAWGSTLDPDMYQVYHKNSSATSVYAWGYREIKAEPTKYGEETKIINKLSEIIDDAREIMDQEERTGMYEEAMNLVLDLAVEMPIYQRKTLYAYNANRIGGLNNNVNPYSTPLEKLWEIELLNAGTGEETEEGGSLGIIIAIVAVVVVLGGGVAALYFIKGPAFFKSLFKGKSNAGQTVAYQPTYDDIVTEDDEEEENETTEDASKND